MATTNHDRVGKALELLKAGLGPFAEREFTNTYQAKAASQAALVLGDDRLLANKPMTQWDAAALLKLMWDAWNEVFRKTLGQSERSLVQELREVRNRWAHQGTFSTDDTYRALDSAARLLTAVSAPQAEDLEKMKLELLRLRFDEQVRGERRRAGGSLIEAGATGALKPWREVVTPHADVASGRYQQAEFAADLWQVHLGEGTDEYKHPQEFFRRTYLTESLKRLLVGGAQRLLGQGGDPVVQLQTNFGGGKTHSMLALYHLFSGVTPGELAGVDAVLAEAGVKNLPKAKRVVLVGNRISPGNPVTKSDGTVVRTLWGELTWQLGGKKALARVQADDEKATSPGDALRRLSGAATYLYRDDPRYWYSTQPTVTKLAEDRAEQLKRNPDKVAQELDERLRADLRQRGDFARVHPMPRSGGDVPDDLDARLVVLPADYPYSREPGNAAETAARAILEARGHTPRLRKNTLVFLAADKVRLQDLDEALRKFLAWESILAEKDTLNLDPHQVRQAETQKQAADGVVTARLPEAYQWLLMPEQVNPQAPITWPAIRLTGSDALAVRASRRLRNEELLVTALGSTILRKHLDDVPLWRGDHVAIRQLVEDFACYLYLPRLAGPEVLVNAIRDGLALLTWEQDAFAYAEAYDEAAARYRGLRGGQNVSILDHDTPGLLVKPDVARQQLDAEMPPGPDGAGTTTERGGSSTGGTATGAGGTTTTMPPGPAPATRPRRFHGSVTLDPTRVGRDAGRIAEEVIAHIAGLTGSQVTVTLEIEATVPDGAPEHVVRIVTENSRTLRFTSHGFETE